MSTDIRTMPTNRLPAGYERVEANWQHAQTLRAHLARLERSGEITVVRPIYRTPAGTVYATIKRHRPARREIPRWVVPVALLGGVGVAIGTAGYLAMKAVESTVEAVTHPTGVGIGFLVILALLLLARVGGGRIVEGTFRGRIK